MGGGREGGVESSPSCRLGVEKLGKLNKLLSTAPCHIAYRYGQSSIECYVLRLNKSVQLMEDLNQ